MKKKVVSLLLAASMVASLAACGNSSTTSTTASTGSDTEASTEVAAATTSEGLTGVRAAEDYDAVSDEIYDSALGEYEEALATASAETNLSTRYALMAIAEAKLLESGVLLPTTSSGGSYVIGRFAPNTVSSVNWGGDEDRFEKMLITTDFVTAEDWAALRQMYGELQGTGTYWESAKAYLEEHGYTLTDTYNYAYSSDPQTWDLFAEWNETLYEPLCGTFDNLYQYDCENTQQPAMATSYDKTVNDDGTVTYTFHIRQGCKWVTSQGEAFADVTADDWVAGAEHLFDCGSGIEELLTSSGCSVVGADEYFSGESSDFSTVGIKAVDDYTLEYTLTYDCPYFLTMLGYTTFSPLCRSYYKSQGGTFSADGDEFTSGDYGLDQDHIVYCGPYLITKADKESSITFVQNPTYWNKDAMTITTINWVYDDSSNAQTSYDNCINGITTATGLSNEMLTICKADGDMFDKYVHISSTNATSFIDTLNLNRQSFANYNDATALASSKTQEQVDATYAAVNNQHFRLALWYSIDRATENSQVKGEDLKLANLNNSYVTGTFCQLEEDVTVAINGTDTTFPAGTYYGEILQAQITADGYPMVVWNEEANDGLGGSTGYDGWYNPDAAKEELALAIEELAAEGYDISAENPIVLDLPCYSGYTVWVNKDNALKQSVETVLDGCVQINIVETSDSNEYYYAGYYCYNGYDCNFDISDITGWSADYGDPISYLNTLGADYSGYSTKLLGIY